MQHSRLVVVNFQIAAAHQTAKHKVHAGQHRALAAEIAVQINPPSALAPPVGRKTPQKQAWLRQPKAVNTLLDVAHHKTVLAIAKQLQQTFLHLVNILIFIHQYFKETLPEAFRHA